MSFDEVCEAYRSKNRDCFAAASESLISKYADHLTTDSIADLALALANSGSLLHLPNDLQPYGDIPSTGGPASMTTLICPVLLASTGVSVPKISATGSVAGAIDAMALIPGFNTELSELRFLSTLRQAGIAHIAQTAEMCPADRVLIELRRQKNCMKHAALAASSLLAKKLVVRGTFSLFDFRLGPCGNIAEDLASAKLIAKLFLDVAAKLHLNVSVVFTNGWSFPCSALGRLESLSLLRDYLRCVKTIIPLDKSHLDACIDIAERAKTSAFCCKGIAETPKRIESLLLKGIVLRKFVEHLESQGASEEKFEETVAIRNKQRTVTITANASGYWVAPNLIKVKEWFQKQQASLSSQSYVKELQIAEQQLGLRLLACPGSRVVSKQPVIEIRIPAPGIVSIDTSFLRGETTEISPSEFPQIAGFYDQC